MVSSTFTTKTWQAAMGAFSALVLLTSPALAQTDSLESEATSSQVVNISGRATEPDGKPLRGPMTIVVDFYDSELAEYPFASISRDTELNDGGVFHLPISTADMPTLPNELWIQLTIGTRSPLPRQRVLASFFARRAAVAEGASKAFSIQSESGYSVTLSAPVDLSDNVTLELPATAGAAGQVLATDGSGKLTWTDQDSSSGSTIDGTNIGTGTGVFAGKSGETLQFKSINGGDGISVTGSGDSVTISSTGLGADAMKKSVYDTSGISGVVDNAEKLGGQLPEYFTNASNLNTGVVSEARIDPAIARDSEIAFKTKSDLTQALSGDYAPSTHTHAMTDITGVLPASQIDSAIARQSDVTYKTEADLRTALDDQYSALTHGHSAADIVTNSAQRFVSDAEKSAWDGAAGQINAATPDATGATLVARDQNGAADFSSVTLGSSGSASITAAPGAAYQLTLPSGPGSADQVLTTDGTGQLSWSDAAGGGGGLRDQSRNLIIKNASSAPTTTMQITADEVIVQTLDSAATPAAIHNINVLLDINSNRDDANLIVSSWYHIWLSYDGTTATGIFSTSSTAPNLGGPFYAYLGAVYVQADGTLIRIFQRGKTVMRTALVAVTGGIATSYTPLDLAAAVPTTAVTISGEAGMSQDFSVYAQGIMLSPSGDAFGEQRIIHYSEANLTDEIVTPFSITVMSPQTLHYQCYHRLGADMCTPARANVFVKVTGWTY